MKRRFSSAIIVLIFCASFQSSCQKNTKALRKEVNRIVDSLYSLQYLHWSAQADSMCAKFKIDNFYHWTDSLLLVIEKEVELQRRAL